MRQWPDKETVTSKCSYLDPVYLNIRDWKITLDKEPVLNTLNTVVKTVTPTKGVQNLAIHTLVSGWGN